MTPQTTTIMIVEDEPLIRRGLQLFVQNRGIHVAGMVDNAEESIEKAIELRPDVILMDIRLGEGMDGIQAAREIKKRDSQRRILMLTSSDSQEDIFASLNAGADGYVLKSAFANSLELAIQTVRHGTVWLDPQIAQRILQVALSAPAASKVVALSSHEKHILEDAASSDCADGLCLVQPAFLENLRRFKHGANAQ